jgi:4-carboxymuconolactone decarboxylase
MLVEAKSFLVAEISCLFSSELDFSSRTDEVISIMKTNKSTRKIPEHFTRFGKKYPEIMAAYSSLGAATQKAGPLSSKERALVKLALAAGAGVEGGVHSHTRRALEAGCTPDEIRHVVLLGTTTLGFPKMMAVLSWIEDVL